MPRKATVTTVHFEYTETSTFELGEKKFVGIDNSYYVSRSALRVALARFDKVVKENPNAVAAYNDSLYVSIKGGRTDFPKNEKFEWFLTTNSTDGVSIGCMNFDKAALKKMRRWANAATVAKTATKTTAKKTATRKAA